MDNRKRDPHPQTRRPAMDQWLRRAVARAGADTTVGRWLRGLLERGERADSIQTAAQTQATALIEADAITVGTESGVLVVRATGREDLA